MYDITDEQLLEIVKAGKDLISDPARWVKGKFAARQVDKDSLGYAHFGADLDQADCFCFRGAMRKVARDRDIDYDLVDRIICERVRTCLPEGEFFVANFNDRPSTTHEQILGVADCLISKLTPIED